MTAVFAFSVVIVTGIRGSFTIKIESSPIIVSRSEEIKIIEKVQTAVFVSAFESRRRLNAVIAEQNTTGIIMYLPKRITISVMKPIKYFTVSFSTGIIKAQNAPKIAPIKNFIQSFIDFYFTTQIKFFLFQ